MSISEIGTLCRVPSCERPIVVKSKQLCDAHYSRLRRCGDLQVDIPVKEYDKDRESYIDKDGYRYIKVHSQQNGWALEHRVVMADHIGRPLLATETVHHRNGVRADNRIENLSLRQGAHGAGQDVEDVIAWAITVLNDYAPNLLQLVEDGATSRAPDNEVGRVVAAEFNTLRGRVLGLLESFGLPEKQEQGCKATFKSLTYDAQQRVVELIESNK
jgi:hypothetical protein